MRKWLLLLLVFSALAFGAEIQNVDYSCGASNCFLRFQFASAKNLPNFFQKFDGKTHKLTVGFSNTKTAFGETVVSLDSVASGIQKVRVFTDASFKIPLLNFEFDVGPEIRGDKNPVSLSKGKFFVISLPKSKSTGWDLKKVLSARAAAEKDAKAAIEKQSKADSVKAVKARAAAEKQAKADSLKLVKQQKADSIREVQEQSRKKVVSALIDGIQEMVGVRGNGIEQFRIVTDSAMVLSAIKGPDKHSVLTVAVPGPKKTPMFNVSSSNIVKSVTWMSSGLRVQLQPNVHPLIQVYKGSLILQIPQEVGKSSGFLCYLAKPEGVYVRKWMDPTSSAETFDAFSKDMEKDKKKIVSVAQSFGLRPVSRNLIVVSETTPFLSAPEEKAQELESLSFGTRLEDIELNGLYYKVRFGSKVGYVNRRAVSFPDELSAVQSERLKQLALDQGGPLDSLAVRFEHPIEERISYSSFGRRDPFIQVKGLMEEGINIDQVELVGIIWESEVPLAILADTKNAEISYTVKEGDRILNGKVLKITQTEVLFLLQEFGVSRRYSMSLPDPNGSNVK